MKSREIKKYFTVLRTGPRMVKWIFEDFKQWNPEREFNVSREKLADYFWETDSGVLLSSTQLKNVKRKIAKVAQIVHGRLFIEDMWVMILPNKRVVIDSDKLG